MPNIFQRALSWVNDKIIKPVLKFATALLGGILGNKNTPDFGGGQDNAGVKQRVPVDAGERTPVVYGRVAWKGQLHHVYARTDPNDLGAYVIRLSEAPSFGSLYCNDVYIEENKVIWDDNRPIINPATFPTNGIYSYYSGAIKSAVDLSNATVSDFNGKFLFTFYTYDSNNANWNSPLGSWTGGYRFGASDPWFVSRTNLMSEYFFAVVQLAYDAKKGISGLPDITFFCESTLTNPAGAIYDYLLNSRYGAGGEVSLSDINLNGTNYWAINTAFNYCNQIVSNVDPVTNVSTNGVLYRIDYLANTTSDRWTNLQAMAKSMGGIVRQSIISGQIEIVYDRPQVSLFTITDAYFIGGLDITYKDSSQIPNTVEISYARNDTLFKNQQDSFTIDLSGDNYSIKDRKATFKYLAVGNAPQANRLAVIEVAKALDPRTFEFVGDARLYGLETGDIVTLDSEVSSVRNQLVRILQIDATVDNDGLIKLTFICEAYSLSAVTPGAVLSQLATSPTTPSPRALANVVPSVPYITNQNLLSTIPNFDINQALPAVGQTSMRIEWVEFYYSIGTAAVVPADSSFKLLTQVYSNNLAGVFDLGTVVNRNITQIKAQPTDFLYFRSRFFNSLVGSNYSVISAALSWQPSIIAPVVDFELRGTPASPATGSLALSYQFSSDYAVAGTVTAGKAAVLPFGNPATAGSFSVTEMANSSSLILVGNSYNPTYASSPDGNVWTTRVSPFGNSGGVANLSFINGRFVSVFGIGIAFSTDGIAWTTNFFSSLASDFIATALIAWNGTRYVLASPRLPYIFYSTDLANWTKVLLPDLNSASTGPFALAAAGTNFSLVRRGGITFDAYYSSDGINWNFNSFPYAVGPTFETNIPPFIASAQTLSSNGTTFLMTTNDWTFPSFVVFYNITSPDGNVWTRQARFNSADTPNALTFTNSQFVARSSSNFFVTTTPLAGTWTKTVNSNAVTGTNFTFFNGNYYFANKGLYRNSALSGTWTLLTTVANQDYYSTAQVVVTSYINGQFLAYSPAVGSSPAYDFYLSTLGDRWTQYPLPVAITNIVFASGFYLIVTTARLYATANLTDVSTWRYQTNSFTSVQQVYVFNNSTYLLNGIVGSATTSPLAFNLAPFYYLEIWNADDSITWDQATFPAAIPSLDYSNGVYWVGSGYISGDGQNFVETNTRKFYPARYSSANGIAFAMERNNRIYRSTDLVNWTSSNTIAKDAWNWIVFCQGQWIAIGSANIARSVDGAVWSSAVWASPIAFSQVVVSDTIILGFSVSTFYASSDLGLTWTSSNPFGVNMSAELASGGGRFVVSFYDTSDNVLGFWSNDGIAWTQSTNDIFTNVITNSRIIWDGNRFVQLAPASGTGFYIYSVSANGTTWTQATPASGQLSQNQYSYFTFGGGYYVVSDANQTTRRSADLITWDAPVTLPVSFGGGGTNANILYFNSRFNFINTNALLCTSIDATAWTQIANWNYPIGDRIVSSGTLFLISSKSTDVALGGATTNYFYSGNTSNIALITRVSAPGSFYLSFAANGLFILIGESNVYTSPDLVNWTTRALPSSVKNVYDVAFQNGVYVFSVQLSTTDLFVIYYTSDFITITVGLSTVKNYASRLMWDATTTRFISYSGSTISGATAQACAYSAFGSSWTINTLNGISALPYGFSQTLFNGSRFVQMEASVSTIFTATSTDGLAWQINPQPARTYSNPRSANGLFFAFASSSATNILYRSSDGISWTSITLPITDRWNNIVFVNNAYFLGREASPTNYRSTDLVTFTVVSTPGITTQSFIAYGNGIFVMIAQTFPGTAVYNTSVDGILWTQRSFPAQANYPTLTQIVFFAGRFFTVPSFVSGQGQSYNSADGLNWTANAFPATVGSYGVVVLRNRIILFTSDSAGRLILYSSPDGFTFTLFNNFYADVAHNSAIYQLNNNVYFFNRYGNVIVDLASSARYNVLLPSQDTTYAAQSFVWEALINASPNDQRDALAAAIIALRPTYIQTKPADGLVTINTNSAGTFGSSLVSAITPPDTGTLSLRATRGTASLDTIYLLDPINSQSMTYVIGLGVTISTIINDLAFFENLVNYVLVVGAISSLGGVLNAQSLNNQISPANVLQLIIFQGTGSTLVVTFFVRNTVLS